MDIHNYKKRLERTLENIRNSDISEENKNCLLEFHDNCILESLSDSKTERYLYDAFRLARMLDKNLVDATKQDLKHIVVEIEKLQWSPHTKHTFKVMIRKLYKFIEGIEEKGVYPERISWLKTNVKNGHTKLPDELLTEKEIIQMIKVCRSRRDRALISVLYESGCRIGEIGSLKIKDVVFDGYGARISVSGKTGSRVVRLVSSAPYLHEWINCHPDNERTSYIWVRGDSKPISYTRMAHILKIAGENANIKKKLNPHNFRHSRATFLAGHLTEAQMKDMLGWTQSSKMCGVYIHLNGRDTEKAVLKLNGIQVEEENQERELEPKKCLRCKTINETTNRFCKTCGFILDKEEAENIIKADAERKEADDIMNKLIKDPEIMELIKKKLKS